MTEEEYILVHDLANLRAATKCLRDIISESNKYLDKQAFKQAVGDLVRYEIQLSNEVCKIVDTEKTGA